MFDDGSESDDEGEGDLSAEFRGEEVPVNEDASYENPWSKNWRMKILLMASSS